MTLQEEAKKIEEKMGLRKFGSCPICADYIEDDGSCHYCGWNDKMTPQESCDMFNEYWKEGNCKAGYEKSKTIKDFI